MPSTAGDEPSLSGMKNPSCLLYGPGDARFEERDIPHVQDPRDVIIRVKFVGVCGSDVHFWIHGGIGQKVSPEKPLVVGHEATGIVDSVGSGVTGLKPGDRVALEPGIPCRACDRCFEGKYNLCPRMIFAGAPPNAHGCLSRFYKLPDSLCYKLPDHIGLEEGVTIEPLAVAVHACRLVGVKAGSTVVVIGTGTVGLLSAAASKAFGAKRAICVDISPARLEYAQKQHIADLTWVPDLEATAEANAEGLNVATSLGAGPDIVIETSGAASSVNIAIHALRIGGSFVQVGLGKPNINFPIRRMSEKELHLHGCFRYGPGDFDLAVGLLDSKKIELSGMVSSIVPFEKATEAWERTRKGVGIKNIIKGPQ